MRVLLVANPVSVNGVDRLVKFPNLGLCSIAANLDKDICEVKIVDLTVAGRNPRKYYRRLLKSYQPDVVGLSSMVFQYFEACELAKITKSVNKEIIVVMGGYYPTVDYDVILESNDMDFIDFVIRHEGEVAFNDFIKALQNGNDFSKVPNLSYKSNGSIIHNPGEKALDLEKIKLPDRNARILKKGFNLFGYPAEVVETSRGCIFDCKYCSITQMYGKKFRKYPIERVIEDIRDAQKHGARAIFMSDDNITLDGKRYKKLCEAIIDAGLHKIKYAIQANIKGIKNTPGLSETIVKSGVEWIFLGFETASDETLEAWSKSNQFKASETVEVVNKLHKYGAVVIGGLIHGNPDDGEKEILANFNFAKKMKVDLLMNSILTPYPKTQIRKELIDKGLVTNMYDYSRYDGWQANVKTKHLSAEKLDKIRTKHDFRYPIESGTLWRLIKKNPFYFAKLIPKRIITEHRDIWKFVKAYTAPR